MSKQEKVRWAFVVNKLVTNITVWVEGAIPTRQKGGSWVEIPVGEYVAIGSRYTKAGGFVAAPSLLDDTEEE